MSLTLARPLASAPHSFSCDSVTTPRSFSYTASDSLVAAPRVSVRLHTGRLATNWRAHGPRRSLLSAWGYNALAFAAATPSVAPASTRDLKAFRILSMCSPFDSRGEDGDRIKRFGVVIVPLLTVTSTLFTSAETVRKTREQYTENWSQ